MKFNHIKTKTDAIFRRLTGVKRTTFDKMIEILNEAYKNKHKKGGRPHSLLMADCLLMSLEYLSEYRPYAHIPSSYVVRDRCAYELRLWVEHTLINSKENGNSISLKLRN